MSSGTQKTFYVLRNTSSTLFGINTRRAELVGEHWPSRTHQQKIHRRRNRSNFHQTQLTSDFSEVQHMNTTTSKMLFLTENEVANHLTRCLNAINQLSHWKRFTVSDSLTTRTVNVAHFLVMFSCKFPYVTPHSWQCTPSAAGWSLHLHTHTRYSAFNPAAVNHTQSSYNSYSMWQVFIQVCVHK